MNGDVVNGEPSAADVPSGPWIVSKAEFARLMGVSKPMVSKWVNGGSLGPALRQDERIDVRLACTNLGRPMPSGAPVITSADLASARPMGGARPDDGDDEPDALLQVRLSTQRVALRRQELDLAEREGRLVDAAAVAAETERLARELRGQVMLVPGDIADQCVGLQAGQIELIIAQALEGALARASG